MSVYTSDTVYCDSYGCPYGYSLIDMADQEECKNGQCEMSKCCNKVCSSYNCPQNHEPVNDADTTVCKDSSCSTDQCCKTGELHSDLAQCKVVIHMLYLRRLRALLRLQTT